MSLHQIKVAREDVLKIVRENKEKHDGILKTAIEGYWIDAEAHLKKFEKEQVDKINKNHKLQLKSLRKQRKEALKSLKTNIKTDLDKVKDRNREKGFIFWNGTYPEDHGDDYNGTIRRLELCVDNEVELDSEEFDSYIRNKWTWKKSFLTCNSAYVNSWATSSYSIASHNPSYAVSASYAITGSCLALANF